MSDRSILACMVFHLFVNFMQEKIAMTPETKWGYEAVNSCGEKPEESWNRISRQIREYYPGATEPQIRKVLGIRK